MQNAIDRSRSRRVVGVLCLLTVCVVSAVYAQLDNVRRPSGVALAKAQGKERLKFNQAPLDFILDRYAEMTGRTILKAPGINATPITLKSQGALSVEERLQAIDSVLSMHGVVVLREGEKFLKVVPIDKAGSEAMPIVGVSGDVPKAPADLVSQMLLLKYIDVTEAEKAIASVKHGYGKIVKFERSNSLLVIDNRANIKRIMEIIEFIDVPFEAKEQTHVIEIHDAKASEVKARLMELVADAQMGQKPSAPRPKTSGSPGVERSRTPAGVMRAIPRRPGSAKTATPEAASVGDDLAGPESGIIRGKVKIVADDRTNVLIIITRKENMTFFEKIIKVLDKPTEPDVKVKVVRLEYAKADVVSSTLNTLIGKKSEMTAKTGGADTKGAAGQGNARSAALREYVQRVEQEAKTAGGGATAKSKVGELSAKNIKILPDKRTNSLLIMASKGDMLTIEEMIKSMDIMLSQVMVEVVIFKITLTDSFERGVDWVQRALISSAQDGAGMRTPKTAFSGAFGGGTYSGSVKDSSGLTAISDLASAGGNLTYYFTFFEQNLDAVIKMVASDNRTKIVSSPQILTTDNKEAVINVTKAKYIFKGLKFVSTSGSGAGEWVDDVELREFGTKLTVTPRVNPKKHVVMEIKQSLEEEGAGQPIRTAGGLTIWPTIDTSDLTAEVAVHNAETIVLGGMVSTTMVDNESKVPILGDIPLIGALFRYKKTEEARNEIVVFITPYVLDTPEEIEAKALEKKSYLDVDSLWPRGWAESKLFEATKGLRPGGPGGLKGLDSELQEFIELQEARWGKAFEEVDRRMQGEVRELAPLKKP